jgi:alpha-N-arabinofuranosidase
MAKDKNKISRKEAMKRLGGLTLGIPMGLPMISSNQKKPISSEDNPSIHKQDNYYVTGNAKVNKPVSPLLYSSFIELGWGKSTDMMWNELLYNRSFEEKEARLGNYAGGGLVKDVDTKDAHWWHDGYEAPQWYLNKAVSDKKSSSEVFDGTWPLPGQGKRCIRLYNKSKNKDILFCQDGIPLRKGVQYNFEGLLNNLQLFTSEHTTKKTVTISICLYKEKDFSNPLAEKRIVVNTGYFKNYKVTLPSVDYEGHGTFAIKIHAGGKLSVDMLSLMPSDNVMGWRKDVVDTLRDKLPLGTIRFPGGCTASTYLWKNGIGDKQKRKICYSPISDGGTQVVQDVGTVEFLNLCRLIDAQPLLDVPVMLNTSEYAAEWVAFCNAPHNTLRESVGYKKPFKVKYWEMDNEPYRKFDPITYAHKVVEFSKAMKKVDPSIKILMAVYFTYDPKLKEMLQIAGPHIDVVNKRENLPFKKYKQALGIINEYNNSHGTHITMCDTEVTFPYNPEDFVGVNGLNHRIGEEKGSKLNKAVRWAHGMSCILNYIKFQNLGGDFIFGNYWALANSYGQNLINVTKENTFLSAPGQAFRFLELANVSIPVKVINDDSNKGIIVQAGWRKKNKEFVVIVENIINETITNTFNFERLDVKSLKCTESYEVYANSMIDYNSKAHPNRIKTQGSNPRMRGTKFSLTSKPYSATYWVFEA